MEKRGEKRDGEVAREDQDKEETEERKEAKQ